MPRARTLASALADAAQGAAGYVFLSGTSGSSGTEVPYARVYAASCRVGRALSEAGLRRGDLVALILADAEAFLTTLFGASMSGLVAASIYPPASIGDLEHYLALTAFVLRRAGARAIVTTRALVPRLDELRAASGGTGVPGRDGGPWEGRRSCPELELVLAWEDLDAPDHAIDAQPALDDIAFVQFTSGSTSSPKGVMVTHRNLSANVDAINGPSGIAASATDVAVSWLPLHHDMGLVGMAIAPVYASRPAVLMPPEMFVKRPAEWLRAVSRHRGTVSFAPNFAYDLCVRRVKDRDLEGLDLSCWRVAGCGAEPIHPPTLEAFAATFSAVGFRETSFLPSYGLAEHVLAATFAPTGRAPRIERVSADDLTARHVAVSACRDVDRDEGSVALVSCGTPLPGHRVEIRAENGSPAPERHVGEIVLAGPSVMRGYYRDEPLTAETIRDGWLHTGDLGYVSDGELYVCGRAKDVIIANGRKYHPQDLEWAVDDVVGVRRGRAVAFGTAFPGGADRVVVVVEPSGTVPAETLAGAIRARISAVFGLAVDEVVLVPSGAVARTTSGKVQRADTRRRYERGELA